MVQSRTLGTAARGGGAGVGVRMLLPLLDFFNHGGDEQAGTHLPTISSQSVRWAQCSPVDKATSPLPVCGLHPGPMPCISGCTSLIRASAGRWMCRDLSILLDGRGGKHVPDRWDLQPPAEGEEAVGGKWLLHMVTTTDVEAGEEVSPVPAVHTRLHRTQLQMYILWQPDVPGGAECTG